MNNNAKNEIKNKVTNTILTTLPRLLEKQELLYKIL